MPLSPNASNLPIKYKGAATAAFLLVLLVAVLPFLFPGGVSAPNPLQVVTAAPNAMNGDDSVHPTTEQATTTQFYAATDANNTDRYL